jgi:ketosteroid isomerase-like protein
MSQANLELVVSMQPGPDVDIAQLFRDEAILKSLATTVAPTLHSDFEAVVVGALRGDITYRGFDGLRELWLDWLSPWEAYRTELEEARDLGDRVLLLVRDFGRRAGATQEVVLSGAAVWTLRDEKIARAEFHGDRATALASVGLAQ